MENASEAIKMAGFVLLFVAALSLAIYTLTNARATSDVILQNSNNRRGYSYIDQSAFIDSASKYKTSRIVKFESVLPTLYRYYKENYRVEFYDKDGSKINLYTPRATAANPTPAPTNAFDIDDEMQANEYWQGSSQATKEHIDELLNSSLSSYWNETFKEELGIIEDLTTDNSLIEDISKQTKRVIRYTVIDP